MGIVIDADCFHALFNERNKLHSKFKPVRSLIEEGRLVMVYGGAMYLKQMEDARVTDAVANWWRIGRAKRVCHKSVDENERGLINSIGYHRTKKGKFNDHHLIAIVIVSKCRLVCTKERDNNDHLTRRQHYPRGCHVPFLFTNRTNPRLLSRKGVMVDPQNTCQCDFYRSGRCKLEEGSSIKTVSIVRR
ncbi:MAG: hypothetical protein MUO36_02505 [Candidatus Hadarchaeum sp.]|nr:hypothetical protein [Candidatus Hadarchaeum sp.]